MGKPIEIGSEFYTYEGLKKAIINDYCGQRGGNIYNDVSSTGSYCKDIFNAKRGLHVIAQGRMFGSNAEIYSDWEDGNESIYTTEYKPKSTNYINSTDNVHFTTIYDYGYDKSTGKEFYLKAEDKNGNGVVDEGEITRYNDFVELFKNYGKN